MLSAGAVLHRILERSAENQNKSNRNAQYLANLKWKGSNSACRRLGSACSCYPPDINIKTLLRLTSCLFLPHSRMQFARANRNSLSESELSVVIPFRALIIVFVEPTRRDDSTIRTDTILTV